MFRQMLVTRLAPYVLGVFSAGMLVPASFADDTRPAAPAGNGGRGAMVNPPDMQGQSQAGKTDFPGAEVNDWVNASAASAQARANFRRAQSDLDAAIRRTSAHFEHSKDYQDALAAERQAYADYTAAREKVLASVMSDRQYHEVIRLRDEIGARLAARRADRNADRNETLALAELKMQYASDARAIEIRALDANGDVKAARDRMVSAGRKALDMRVAFDDSVRESGEILQYRNNVENSRVAVLTAEAYNYASAIAADAAYYYNIFLHRNDQGYYAPYGPAAVSYGNGGGYYSPYWGR